jgi:hypothetical protein
VHVGAFCRNTRRRFAIGTIHVAHFVLHDHLARPPSALHPSMTNVDVPTRIGSSPPWIRSGHEGSSTSSRLDTSCATVTPSVQPRGPVRVRAVAPPPRRAERSTRGTTLRRRHEPPPRRERAGSVSSGHADRHSRSLPSLVSASRSTPPRGTSRAAGACRPEDPVMGRSQSPRWKYLARFAVAADFVMAPRERVPESHDRLRETDRPKSAVTASASPPSLSCHWETQGSAHFARTKWHLPPPGYFTRI